MAAVTAYTLWVNRRLLTINDKWIEHIKSVSDASKELLKDCRQQRSAYLDRYYANRRLEEENNQLQEENASLKTERIDDND